MRKCGKDSCVWIGTLTGAAMPGAIDGVRLAEDAGTARTADYGWRAPIAKGAVLAVVGLALDRSSRQRPPRR